jgi:hypothetical protein
LGSVSQFVNTLAHLALGNCQGEYSASEVKCLCRTVPNYQIFRSFHVLLFVLLLCVCDPLQTLISLRTSFLFLNQL